MDTHPPHHTPTRTRCGMWCAGDGGKEGGGEKEEGREEKEKVRREGEKRMRGKERKGERVKREDECVGDDELMDNESRKKMMGMTVWWLIEVRKELLVP